jgi:SAM-dependent methyltransferase
MTTDELRQAIRLRELVAAQRWFPAGARVLEIGAGSGWQARALADRGFAVEAVDLAGGAYETVEVFPVRKYNGGRLPYGDHAFDVVFSSNVLEHVPGIEAMLAETARVLAPGGVVVHVMPSTVWRAWTCLTHYVYAARVLRALLSGRRNGDRDLFFERNLESLASSGEHPMRRALRRLLPQRHGETGTTLDELWLFSARRWSRVFRRAGWHLEAIEPAGLFYTGYWAFGSGISITARGRLAALLGSACTVYVARR